MRINEVRNMAIEIQKQLPLATIAAGYRHTVGLKADGTMLAVSRNNEGQGNVVSNSSINNL